LNILPYNDHMPVRRTWLVPIIVAFNLVSIKGTEKKNAVLVTFVYQ